MLIGYLPIHRNMIFSRGFQEKHLKLVMGASWGGGGISRYREAELKHGRLAMVALAGWPVASIILALLTGVRPGATASYSNVDIFA